MVNSILSCTESKKRQRQSVKFEAEEAQVVAEVESCFDFPEDIRRDLWHSRDDYEFSRSSAKVIAKESERYGHSRHLDFCYPTESLSIQAFDADGSVRNALKIWCLHGHSRRGLERWSNSLHGRIRKDDQYMYIHGVLKAQAEMKLKSEYCPERLREISYSLSRKSRLFGQLLGEADSYAAQSELGMIDATASVSPRQRRKNLGLSRTSNTTAFAAAAIPSRRSSAVAPPSHAVRRSLVGNPIRRASDTRSATRSTPNISIRTKSGRVPRMA